MTGKKTDELRETIREAMGLPVEIDVAERIREIAARMMKHPDSEVRSMAGEILRHVKRLETAK